MLAGATYDEIGNPLTYGTGDEAWTFSWQRGRQLSSLTTPDHTISYKYNADGLRTEKTVDGVTWEYIWDGSKLIAMYDGTTEWRFIYDAGGEVIGFIRGASTYYYVKNLQGDVIKILDNYCSEIVTYTYDSWGNVIAQGGSSAYVSLGQKNPIRYRGYFYDTDTGLYYLQSRYYNPQWGRFINADGYVQTGQGILDKNMFAYCGNNPINRFDPTGHSWFGILAKAVKIAVKAVIKTVIKTAIVSTAVNYAINYVNKKKIEKEVKPSYTQDEAKEKIESIMSVYQRNPSVTFNDSTKSVKIMNSTVVKNRYDRQRIGMILANTEGFEREYDNIAAEWNAHNVVYSALTSVESVLSKVNIESTWVTNKIERCQHVDIDYVEDRHPEVRFATTAFEVLGWD